ncbi:hypothetical protein [Phocaeicola sp.]|uniref:hypothetical protein n=1 Tax=Phocaeicola sp. TaxID=2773926 RepID=UPI00307BBD69
MSNKDKKVIFVNATLLNNVHEIIDSSLIIELSSIFPNVAVYLTHNRCEIIKKNITPYLKIDNVTFYKLKIGEKRSGINDLIAAIKEGFLLLKSRHNSIFVFSYINMFSCHILNLIAKLTNKTILICCHSELETIQIPNVSIKQIWYYLMQRFFKTTRWGKYVYLMVLGDNIHENLKSYIGIEKYQKIYAIDHPYFMPIQLRQNMKIPDLNKINIGIIGSVNKSYVRGFKNIIQFAEKIRVDSSVTLNIISKIDMDLIAQLPSNVIVHNTSGEFLPKSEYDKLIQQMDYIYLPYPQDCFKFTASGAVLEAIFQQKVLLMHSNDYCTYLTKKYGRFGLFIEEYDNINELANDLHNKLLYNDLLRKQQFLAENITPQKLTWQLQNIINDISKKSLKK